MNDTIVAIATSLGVGAISIIRVSGNDSIKIVNKIFKEKNLDKKESHTITYGHIIDENRKIIDEVLVSIMKSPRSFTTEDVVEINCHGGIAITNKILELLLNVGCRLAEPGEFTKRAYLNGRIDLLEAESIMDLINAKTEASRTLAINQLNGEVSKLINDLRERIVKIITNIEVNIDYPEYDDIHEVNIIDINNFISELKLRVDKIIKESNSGKIIKNGVDIALIGSPNVGKSSILNKLLNEEKAIVTDIPGTTRDIVEGSIILNGVLLNITDTAGIRETSDKVEKIGVDKSLKTIDDADLILFVLNNNEIISEENIELYNKIKNRPHIVIINKIDLESLVDLTIFEEYVIMLSALNNNGFDTLKNEIIKKLELDNIELDDLTYLSDARSISIIKKVSNIISDIEIALKNDIPIDMIEIDLKNIWNLLGSITGESYEEEFLDELFSRFCLGK